MCLKARQTRCEKIVLSKHLAHSFSSEIHTSVQVPAFLTSRGETSDLKKIAVPVTSSTSPAFKFVFRKNKSSFRNRLSRLIQLIKTLATLIIVKQAPQRHHDQQNDNQGHHLTK